MDKQKQMIEEMAKDICEYCFFPTCAPNKTCDSWIYAKNAVEQGYRKIPEGSVVLTREENEKWLDFLELNMSKTRQRIVKEVLQKVKSYTLDKEVGMKYLLKRLGQEYGVEIE